jgi:hypothetical protein
MENKNNNNAATGAVVDDAGIGLTAKLKAQKATAERLIQFFIILFVVNYYYYYMNCKNFLKCSRIVIYNYSIFYIGRCIVVF